jgi:hypothetical protein
MLCKSEGSASVVVYLLTANVGCRNGHIRPLFQPTEQITRSISSQNLGPAYSNAELSAEAHLLIAAGSDKTSTTLGGLFFYLTRYPRVYKKLTMKIQNTFESSIPFAQARRSPPVNISVPASMRVCG